eukprot:scaffold13273_cov35-Attheya_sp.AAC.3
MIPYDPVRRLRSLPYKKNPPTPMSDDDATTAHHDERTQPQRTGQLLVYDSFLPLNDCRHQSTAASAGPLEVV